MVRSILILFLLSLLLASCHWVEQKLPASDGRIIASIISTEETEKLVAHTLLNQQKLFPNDNFSSAATTSSLWNDEIGRILSNTSINSVEAYLDGLLETNKGISNIAFILSGKNGLPIYSYRFGEINYPTRKDQSIRENLSFEALIPVDASSQLITTITVLNLVTRGLLKLESTTGQLLGWKNFSSITLEDLLSQTSGLPGHHPKERCSTNSNMAIGECVGRIYKLALEIEKNIGVPKAKKIFWYGPYHLQIVGRMVEVALSRKLKRPLVWNQIFEEFIKNPLQLNPKTQYYSDSIKRTGIINPSLANGLLINMQDYYKLMYYLVELGKSSKWHHLVDRVVESHNEFSKKIQLPSNMSRKNYDYGLGVWRNQEIVSAEGKFGWYPWFNLNKGYFALIGMMAYSENGIGCDNIFKISLEISSRINDIIVKETQPR
ncbi:MAG: hypothetical protein A2504_02385 [Bdellovibrionales bacterium RIFOXYD12_FULL_39_22]|nr:MAG: hypothetical protein A2385_12415 [Bdellovibrionales bacterium RIFOXYB1_FULL_39_21]OFZ41152.1 MAG: hypothetical protein A2485_00825 [Bdellovibrionales bacterium RIFOXYC12_FULL_39_17]OFZ44906.1 MAG: hypothetical protein A2404_11570 [Bdellovibrionales bacterium RIFOXYC1_FULL_39_130]OFZ74353.1 MAG: hypothetical protein A2560_11940 [Bdellovibrionales bacterium RIFOXYD1_FULL_39_84]OFZ74667.1 MAG: hypothetical protein A2451_08495 [Bdellovibrionales bacterium RIFOXYC2_FULL_39_8]OFZ92355.1 MAG: